MAYEKYSYADETYQADQAIAQYRVVIHGGGDGHCKYPTAAGGAYIAGVTQEASTASGDFIRVRKGGLSKVLLGGTVTRGHTLEAFDTVGKAYEPTVYASGEGTLGEAEVSGVSGDIGVVWLEIGTEH